jgi:phosphatidylserine/phosphatidylglycerophosphate/cardiolipin synthase-like enzyme
MTELLGAQRPFEPLVGRGLDPADAGFRIIGWHGRRLAAPLAQGDVLFRRAPSGGRDVPLGIVSDPALLGPSDLRREGPLLPGRYVRTIGLDGAAGLRRIASPEGYVAEELVIVRGAAQGEAELAPLPPGPRPTVRRGSSGPAVGEAQAKLNRVHALETAQGRAGLDQCPLEVDGRFGPKTQAAVLSFQRLAFPGEPREWDGIVGPKTWTRLDAYAPDAPPIVPPDVPPDLPPVIPVNFRPLDPARWDPIIRGALSSSAIVRPGNAVKALVDGPETYREMARDIAAAAGEGDYVYLLGWDFHDNFDLAGPGTTMAALLAAASARGVQIRAMLWAKPPLVNRAEVARIDALPNGAAIRDNLTHNNTPRNSAQLAAILAAAGISPMQIPLVLPLVLPHLIRFTGAHHQKVLVVKREGTLIGYCGGLDINPNRVRSVNPSDPQHDDHCRIRGPAAWDLLDTFVRRWRHHPDSTAKDAAKGPLRGLTEPVPAPIARPAPQDSPFGGTASVAIARTFNPVRAVPGVPRERDIKRLLLTAIGRADRFIYIEDQYLIDRDTARALNRAMPRLSHLTILIPGTPISDLPFGAEYRRDFVDALVAGLSPADRAKVGIFQLSSTPTPPPTFGPHTYVHAKSWVFDDELAVIGSANCNRRGYEHDSEADAFIFDDPQLHTVLAAREGAESVMLAPTWAQRYRMRLWAEHLGVPQAAVIDGVSSAALWRTAVPPTARVVPFDHRLPPGAAQSLRDRVANAVRDIVDPTVP